MSTKERKPTAIKRSNVLQIIKNDKTFLARLQQNYKGARRLLITIKDLRGLTGTEPRLYFETTGALRCAVGPAEDLDVDCKGVYVPTNRIEEVLDAKWRWQTSKYGPRMLVLED